MPSLRRSLPSLSALIIFESAARLGGFTTAARELGVTQAAVSRQIRQLEIELRAPLFVRAHRRVELTPAGTVLAMAVGRAFDGIGDAIEVIRPAANTAPPNLVRVGATLAFSHFWLLPRLPIFRTAHPDVALRLVSEDLPLDLRDGTVDVVLRYGRPPFRDGEVVASMPDEVVPVCSPALRESVGQLPFPENLLALPRIAAEAHDATWTTWRRWLVRMGLERVDAPSALQFNHYNDAIYAAINGQGAALGWANLLERPLSEGRLVRLCAQSIKPEETYNLVVPRGTAASPMVVAFISWISELMSKTGQEHGGAKPRPSSIRPCADDVRSA
jgi:DNA-binding transcriptional LysR family regulator